MDRSRRPSLKPTRWPTARAGRTPDRLGSASSWPWPSALLAAYLLVRDPDEPNPEAT